MKQRRVVTDKIEAAVIIGDNLVFEPHAHDEFVISTNVFGNEKLCLNGKALIAPEGTTTLYNPSDIQSGEGTSYLISLYLQHDYFETEFGENHQVLFTNPIIFDHKLQSAMQKLISPVLNDENSVLLEELVVGTLLPAVQRYSNTKASLRSPNVRDVPSCDDWRVRRLKEILLSDLGSMPSLDTLASQLNMRKPQMLRMYKLATGLPPARWQRQVRLREGRRRLREGQPVSRVATELGFADQAHFSRLFRSAYGIPPGKFSKLHLHSRATG